MSFEKNTLNILFPCLPHSIRLELAGMLDSGKIRFTELNEIRLRALGRSGITLDGVNLFLKSQISELDISECVGKLCRGSVYAHDSTMRIGYILFEQGIRVGVCGSYSPDSKGIREITSVNIRLPHIIRNVCDNLMAAEVSNGKIKSFLIYSAPGKGKTTLLRDIAAKLCTVYKRRITLIDTRGEIYIKEMFRDGMCDVLTGYPRGLGMEIATRYLSTEVIICDELGDMEETRKILEAQNTGVPIIASAHGDTLEGLLSRPNIRLLYENRVFDEYVRINREFVNGRQSSSFTFHTDSANELVML